MTHAVRRRVTGALIGVPVVIAVSVSCTDTVPAATSSPPLTAVAPPGSQPGPTQTGPTDTTPSGEIRQPDDLYISAEISPNVATADQRITVTPFAPAQPTCGITMAFYDPYLWGDGELFGVLLATGEWVRHDPNVTTTVLACLPPPVSDPFEARIPAALVDGLYRACVGSNGCGLLRIVRPGEIDGGVASATAEPTVVAPGDEFVVAPAHQDALVCSRHELLVGIDGELDLVGFPAPSGDIALPVPGATTTVPRCGYGAQEGFPTESITFVTPDVPDGAYLFCLAYRSEPDGCARVDVAR